MTNCRLGTVAMFAILASAPLLRAAGPLAISVDEKTQSYTITEQGRPVLTYRFGEVPLPAGVQASHFSKRDAPYDGAYFTDGSRYGGERSDYIYPLYGFHGESLTARSERVRVKEQAERVKRTNSASWRSRRVGGAR